MVNYNGGAPILLSCITTPTSLRELLYGAPNNYGKRFLFPQCKMSLPDIGTGMGLLQPLRAEQRQQRRAQILQVIAVVTLLDCINQMPAGRVLLVTVQVTQKSIDVGGNRPRHTSRGGSFEPGRLAGFSGGCRNYLCYEQ